MTTQVPDRLLLAGVEFSCGVVRGRIPDKHPGIRAATEEDLARATHREELELLGDSTALWRGYIATWVLKGRRLYLDNIEGTYAKAASEPIFADWVSDTLELAMGSLLLGPKLNYYGESLFERQLRVHVQAGRVVRSLLIDWRASCPASLRQKDKMASRRWHLRTRGGSLPSLSVEQLAEPLGKVEVEETRPIEWWEYNYSANKSKKERQALLKRLHAWGRKRRTTERL